MEKLTIITVGNPSLEKVSESVYLVCFRFHSFCVPTLRLVVNFIL